MTRAEGRRIYFDACVFLAYVGAEAGRVGVVEELLRHATRGLITIITSTVTIAEVAFGATEKQQRALDAATEERIDSLWSPGGPVRLIEASRPIMVAARGLVRARAAGGGRLSPLDAIHLATAQAERVDHLATYEVRVQATWSQLIGLEVSEPKVEQPPLELGQFGGW